jgi:hypothetical protein
MAWGQKPDWPAQDVTEPNKQAESETPGKKEQGVDASGPLIPEMGPEPATLIDETEPIPAEEMAEIPTPTCLWLRAEYLLWWIKNSTMPPLITTGPSTDPLPGSLDSGNTSVLFGGGGQDNKNRSGGRFFAGYWLTDDNSLGLEAGYFFLGPRAIGIFEGSPGNPVLARPFFNVNRNFQDSSLVAWPGLVSGSIRIQSPSFLQGTEMNLVSSLARTNRLQLDAFLGFRYLNLGEGLHIDEFDQVSATSPQFAGTGIIVSDWFDVQNNFFGGQLGVRADWHWKRFVVNLLAKVAVGESYETVTIRGSTQLGTQPTIGEGFLALSSNSGRFGHNAFAVAPEVNLNLGFQISENLRAFAGYSFLYWSQVARPADQMDIGLNENLIPTSKSFGSGGGPARPAFAFHPTDFWAHGINLGLEFRY